MVRVDRYQILIACRVSVMLSQKALVSGGFT